MFLGFTVSLINSVTSGPLEQVNQGMVTIAVRIICIEKGRKKFGWCSKEKILITTLIITQEHPVYIAKLDF